MDSIEDYLIDSKEGTNEERQCIMFFIGICYLKIFLQNNWTGPSISVPKLFPSYSSIHFND
jgi:hypothetical protein